MSYEIILLLFIFVLSNEYAQNTNTNTNMNMNTNTTIFIDEFNNSMNYNNLRIMSGMKSPSCAFCW